MSATYEGMSPGGHEAYATSIFSKIKTYLDSNPYGYLTTHQDISGKADTDDLARGYSSDTVQLYNTGDLVYHDGDMYRCINGTSGGNWISSCWQRTSVATELENKIEGLVVAGSSGGSYASEVTTSIWFDPNQFNYITGSHKVELNSNFDPSNKVDKAGDTISGDLDFAGGNVFLRTPSSSSDDSGDIAFYYGNGAEKCRIWTSNEYTAAAGPNYRVYKKDGSALYSGRLATLGDLSWGNISGKPSTFPPSSHSHDYLPTGGGTMTGIVYSSYGSASWVNSLTKSAISLNDTIGFGGWICGPTKNGRIAIATYKNGDDILYFGYGERGRTTNSYTRRAYWNGANGMFASTVVLGESMLRSSYIGRNDSGDSGYINHVNTGNTAYAPTRASAFTTMSCKYTKTNVVDISEEDALKLLDIRPVNFDYVEEVGGQKNQIGVLAEDTYKILPKVVSVPDDYVEEDFDISKGIHQPLPSVDYAKFVPYLIKMVQIQQKEIDILKEKISI